MHNKLLTALAASLMALAACNNSEVPTGTEQAPGTGPGNSTLAEDESSAMVWHRAGHRATLVNAVERWNDNIDEFGRLAFIPPPVESRMTTMANVTVHDILNAVDHRFEQYAYKGTVRRPLSVEAAIATGTYDVLSDVGKGLPTPEALEFITKAYTDYLAELGECDEITRGKQLGHDAAAAMLALRANDGSAPPWVLPFTSTGEPGKYRPTPGPATNLTGPQALASWGTNVKPWVLKSASQFRAPPMYGAATVSDAVKTPLYLADYAEVKRLGGMVSERTTEQTEIGLFWVESTIQGWNRIARVLAKKEHLNAWRLARVLAHVSLAEADAYLSTFESKYYYNFWRPVTAIRLGNLDPATPGDPSWEVASMLIPALGATPIIPDYNSGHSIAGAAAGEALIETFGNRSAFSTTSGSLPGVTRSFRSIGQAVSENALSRVYVGFHFRQATVEGVKAGQKVGQYVVSRTLRRERGH
jgi:hypothetical protein